LLNLRQDCGGKILGERSGSIHYSLHPDSLLFNRINNGSTDKLLVVSCTWIIDAHKNQTVWIDVISVGKGAIGIQFGNGDTMIYEKEERASSMMMFLDIKPIPSIKSLYLYMLF